MATYNDASRSIIGKLEVYFSASPTTITADDYLMDFQVTEELTAESTTPLGAVSANELSFTLSNFDNRFSPANSSGPFYGQIGVGTRVNVFIALDEVTPTWTQLGVYYVTSWQAKLGDAVATVTCTDIVQELLQKPMPDLDIKFNTDFHLLSEYILAQYGYPTAVVDSILTAAIPYGIVFTDTTRALFEILTIGAMAYLIATRTGGITVKKIVSAAPVFTLTDDDQIISINVMQSILKTYGGVSVEYTLPQISDFIEVLRVDDLSVPMGTTTFDLIKYPNLIHSLSGVTLQGPASVVLVDYMSTNFGLIPTLQSSGVETVSLSASGRIITFVNQVLSDNVANMLPISNGLIQTAAYAAAYKTVLSNLATADIPELNMKIRGNPLIKLGDTVQVNSARYAVTFTGIVKRMVYNYNGALSCEATLLNAGVFA